jgi:hypothetical protein
MDIDRFIYALAHYISSIMPDGFHVWAAGGILHYSADPSIFKGQLSGYKVGPTGTSIKYNFGSYGTSESANIIGAAIQALSELQDYISEATHIPWPGTSRQALAPGVNN